uniref:Uncharacterized protein n=1 Tax=Romanomermis culicivorax TaxID=13658 RepID=A0A915I3I5_ROMCU
MIDPVEANILYNNNFDNQRRKRRRSTSLVLEIMPRAQLRATKSSPPELNFSSKQSSSSTNDEKSPTTLMSSKTRFLGNIMEFETEKVVKQLQLQLKPEQPQSEQMQPEQLQPEQLQLKHWPPEQAQLEQLQLEQAQPEQWQPGQVPLEQLQPEQTVSLSCIIPGKLQLCKNSIKTMYNKVCIA